MLSFCQIDSKMFHGIMIRKADGATWRFGFLWQSFRWLLAESLSAGLENDRKQMQCRAELPTGWQQTWLLWPFIKNHIRAEVQLSYDWSYSQTLWSGDTVCEPHVRPLFQSLKPAIKGPYCVLISCCLSEETFRFPRWSEVCPLFWWNPY